MREIKFRAWEDDAEDFIYSTDVDYDNYQWGFENGELKCWSMVERGSDPMEPPEEVFEELPCIEQSTGLKDKNGTPIYEGDMVKLKDGRKIGVEWSTDKYEPLHWLRAKELEVIGNIHQPELMENHGNA